MKFSALLISLLLIATSAQSQELVSKSRWTLKTVEVHFIRTKSAVTDKCVELGLTGSDRYYGCARTKPDNDAICEVYMVEPRDFDDEKALETLGHETWHCFGAKHN